MEMVHLEYRMYIVRRFSNISFVFVVGHGTRRVANTYTLTLVMDGFHDDDCFAVKF